MAEPAAPCFLDGFARTGKLIIGAATRAETWLAVHNAKGPAGAPCKKASESPDLPDLESTAAVRIDHILAGPGWRCGRCWVGPDVGSPHRPLLADLVYSPAQGR